VVKKAGRELPRASTPRLCYAYNLKAFLKYSQGLFVDIGEKLYDMPYTLCSKGGQYGYSTDLR
jgi:hypothetical protein